MLTMLTGFTLAPVRDTPPRGGLTGSQDGPLLTSASGRPDRATTKRGSQQGKQENLLLIPTYSGPAITIAALLF